jgi:predicted DNA binding CopG/RHH family protein
MQKKSFKDNPALQFISEAKDDIGEMPEKLASSVKAPEGYKLNPLYIETKTRRLQIVMQPSLYKRVKNAAEEEGLSVNEFIHRTLDRATLKTL